MVQFYCNFFCYEIMSCYERCGFKKQLQHLQTNTQQEIEVVKCCVVKYKYEAVYNYSRVSLFAFL